MDFNQNYFEIFGLPIDYLIDLDLLADRFIELQKEVHPDRFAAGTEQEKRLSMQWATMLNTASTTLKSPLSRAIYLLELKGVALEQNPTLTPAFLMEQIELREALEDIETGDGNLEQLDAFKADVNKVMKKSEVGFGESIDTNPDAATQHVYELQFMTKLLTAADQIEEKLLDY